MVKDSFACPAKGCERRFGMKPHLQRHINVYHPEHPEAFKNPPRNRKPKPEGDAPYGYKADGVTPKKGPQGRKPGTQRKTTRRRARSNRTVRTKGQEEKLRAYNELSNGKVDPTQSKQVLHNLGDYIATLEKDNLGLLKEVVRLREREAMFKELLNG